MKCKKCNSKNVKVCAVVRITIDSNDFPVITKKVIAKKTTQLHSLVEEKTVFICSECGSTWGFGYNKTDCEV